MNLLKNDSAQSGTLIFIIAGIFLIGIIYVMLGPVMNGAQEITNDQINNTAHSYSQERRDMMDNIFLSWWAFPIYMLILFVIYGIKKAIDKQSGESY